MDDSSIGEGSGGPPHVAIVMCTRNGERFLSEQLASIASQTHRAWSLIVSDDGSTDGTVRILRAFAAGRGSDSRIELVEGPRRGSAVNFATTLGRAGRAPYYAFSDQDDVWLPNKLARALSRLEEQPARLPALYCGRTRIIDVAGRPIGFSPAFLRPPSFRNALVQSIAGGNTMVMNAAARDLLCAAGPDDDIVSHDWWAYQIVSGAGGRVIYDPEPTVLYRRHEHNQVGDNLGMLARLSRMEMLLRGRFRAWMDCNTHTLRRVRRLLTPENQQMLERFGQMRCARFPQNLLLLRELGLYRQTLPGDLGLIAALLLRKA